MDAKEGFWAITLKYTSSFLTTFNMSYGRYRFFHLTFGLKCSQDIFQMRMDQLCTGLPGTLAVHDDVTVYGKDEQAHDPALYNIMKRAEEYRLAFNTTKCFIKQPNIEFFGRPFSADGITPDPAKIQGMLDLPPPEGTTQTAEFPWNCQLYAAICTTSEPSHCTTESNASEECHIWLDTLSKCSISEDEVTAGRDIRKQPKVLWQELASNSSSRCQIRKCRCSTSATRTTYYFCIKTPAESDHKPLEMITLKNLVAAPSTTAAIWCNSQKQARERDVTSRCTITSSKFQQSGHYQTRCQNKTTMASQHPDYNSWR